MNGREVQTAMNSAADILAESAVRFGPKTALISGERTLSFEELADRARRLAAALAGMGVGPGDKVVLYSPNRWEWVVAYHGVLMTGAVVVPINVMLTPEEVAYVVRDCGARVVAGAREKLEPLFPLKADGSVAALICFGADVPDGMAAFDALAESGDLDFTPVAAAPESTGSICYTSGTTGHPKGAMQLHRSVLANAQLTALMHGRRETDTVVSALPLPHVYGTVVMNSTFITGGTVVVHPLFEEAAVLDSIQRYRATLFEGVPTMYFFLLNHPGLDSCDLSSLRLCTVGGQTMPVAKMQEVEERFRCPLIELWGMTELAGLGTTFSHFGPVKHGSIGVALPYCEARIADLEYAGRTLPAGEVGELEFRGPVTMQGYYGNETATRETITEDGWLRTGDVAYADEDGFVFIVDRKKDMIITAGYNIYPAEIERVVAGHPDVAMVAVGAVPDPDKGELAKAYVVPKLGSTPEGDAIIAYCREHLAAYKMPRAVQFVEDLPKTSSGKVMRRKLKEIDDGLQGAGVRRRGAA